MIAEEDAARCKIAFYQEEWIVSRSGSRKDASVLECGLHPEIFTSVLVGC